MGTTNTIMEIQYYINIHMIYAGSIRRQTDIQTDGQMGGPKRQGRGNRAKQSEMEDNDNWWTDGGRTRAMKDEMQDERRTRQGAE